MRTALVMGLCLVALAAGGCGGGRERPDANLVLAERAKTALLELMRSGENPFEGCDPDRLGQAPVVIRAPGRYAWGPFDLDLVRAIYRAEVRTDRSVARFAGKFTVDAYGHWNAKWPEERHWEAPAGGP